MNALTSNSRLNYSITNSARICRYNHEHEDTYTMLGLDTHADISCAGCDAHIISKIDDRTCKVHPFNDSYKAMTGVEIVNVLFKYENTERG